MTLEQMLKRLVGSEQQLDVRLSHFSGKRIVKSGTFILKYGNQ